MKENDNTNLISSNNLQEKLVSVIEYIKFNHKVKTNSKLAELINFGKTNLSAAINGNERYLTSGLFDKICSNFPEINRRYFDEEKAEMLLRNFKQIKPNKEVDTVDEISIPDLESEDLEKLDNSFGNEFVKLPNGQYLMYMPLFEWNVAASLLDNNGDTRHPDYDSVERYATIVDKPLNGKYSAFRIKGVSMEGEQANKFIPDGSIAWGRELQFIHWSSKLNIRKYPLWIVGSTDFGRPTLKEIVDHDVKTATITVDSWNPSAEFAHNVPISLNTVKMLYYVMKIETPIADGVY